MPKKLSAPPKQPWEILERRDGTGNVRWDRDVELTLEQQRQAREAAWHAYRRRQRLWLAGILTGLAALALVVVQFTGLTDLRTAGPRLWARAVERFGPVAPQPVRAPTPAAQPTEQPAGIPAVALHELPPPTVVGAPLQPSKAMGDGIPGQPVPPAVQPPPAPSEPVAPGTALYHLYHKSGEKMIDEATR